MYYFPFYQKYATIDSNFLSSENVLTSPLIEKSSAKNFKKNQKNEIHE